MNSETIVPRARSFSFYQVPQGRYERVTEILRSLHQPQKTLDPKLFYDQRGSKLYELITKTFDYYVARTEREILRRYAAQIAAAMGTEAVLIEPGSGNCQKIEYLLEALRPRLYVPIDTCSDVLEAACSRLASRYDWLPCFGIGADFNQFDEIANLLPSKRRVVFFPGSTIGNFEPEQAVSFLRRLRKLVQLDGGVLIGVDNIKDSNILHCAYNDSSGLTAEFNKNILLHVNRIAPANFSPSAFDHKAFFNSEKSRVEMHLVSRLDQIVDVAGQKVNFNAGETIHTENSYKYTRSTFRSLAAEAGLRCVKTWHDERDYFTLYYFVCDPQTLISEYYARDFSLL